MMDSKSTKVIRSDSVSELAYYNAAFTSFEIYFESLVSLQLMQHDLTPI
jgi:hypothetical protein